MLRDWLTQSANKRKMKNQKRTGISFLYAGIIFFIIMTIIYNIRNYWPEVLSSVFNVNYGLKAVDTVWLNEGNTYHNDTLIYTILKDKKSIFNKNSWYADYLRVFSKNSIEDNSIPEFISVNALNMNDFTEVGYILSHVHSTLVDHQISEIINNEGEIPKLYVNTIGIDKSDKIVVINDEQGNLYLMSEDYWNEESN